MTHPFYALHSHRMIRVAAATPQASVGDCARNAEGTIAIAEQAHDRGVDLVVYPWDPLESTCRHASLSIL